MKHIAYLSTGGKLEITLPLIPAGDEFPPFWRMDQAGLLINLRHVVSISGAESKAEKKLVALIDGEGDHWKAVGQGFLLEPARESYVPYRRAEIETQYGIREEVWE